MPKENQLPGSLVGLVVILAAATGFAPPQDGKKPQSSQRPTPSGTAPVFQVTSDQSELRLTENFSKTVALDKKIRRVDGFDPKVVKVTALSPKQIRVQALAPGVTTMVLVDESDKHYSVEVFVTGDVRHLQAYLNQLFPHASVQAVEIRDAVVLRGWVTQPEHITELMEIAEQFYPRVLNQMKVGGAQQVMLKVKVMEVNRTKIRKLGLNFLDVEDDGFLHSAPGMLTPLSTEGDAFSLPFGGPPSVSVSAGALADPTLSLAITGSSNIFAGFIEALKEERLLKIKAEPKLVTTNGRPAHILNGGEFPVLVPQSLGTTTIEWREFGVRMEAVPVILGNGRLRLELAPEVSQRDFSNSVTTQGFTVPGLTTRRVNTQVEMKFGQTLMIGGLISTRNTAETAKVPILGEIPWLGAAFSRKEYQQVETELVVMVTPEYVAPLDPGQVPRGGPGQSTGTPTDRELYIDGMLEVPKYGPKCQGCPPPAFPAVDDPGMLQPKPESDLPKNPKPKQNNSNNSAAKDTPQLPPPPSNKSQSSRSQGGGNALRLFNTTAEETPTNSGRSGLIPPETPESYESP